MPALTIEYRDDAERLALEQAIAYVAHLRQLAQDAPDGTVLAACEQLALTDGRALLRATLAAAVAWHNCRMVLSSRSQPATSARACWALREERRTPSRQAMRRAPAVT